MPDAGQLTASRDTATRAHLDYCEQIVRVLFLDHVGRPVLDPAGATAAVTTCVHGHSATVRREPVVVTRPEITPEERAFADDWNAGVLSRDLSERYLLSRPQVEALRVRLSNLGLPMQDRRGSHVGKSAPPSAPSREAHAVTSAGAFKRGQL